MLGPSKSRRLDPPIGVSLEDLVPRNSFDRHLDAKLDLDFVGEWGREAENDRQISSKLYCHLPSQMTVLRVR